MSVIFVLYEKCILDLNMQIFVVDIVYSYT